MPQADNAATARQRTLRQAIRDRLAQIDMLMAEEPLGMVSKPHICWATDQLSILSRHVRDLLAEEER